MKKHLLLLTAWLVGISVLWAQNASDRVVPITVTTNANPPSITLTFPTTPIDTITFIGRKQKRRSPMPMARSGWKASFPPDTAC